MSEKQTCTCGECGREYEYHSEESDEEEYNSDEFDEESDGDCSCDDETHIIVIADVHTPFKLDYEYNSRTETVGNIIGFLISQHIYENNSIKKVSIHGGAQELKDPEVRMASLGLACKDLMFIEGRLCKKSLKRYTEYLQSRTQDVDLHRSPYRRQKLRDTVRSIRTAAMNSFSSKRRAVQKIQEQKERQQLEAKRKKQQLAKERVQQRIKLEKEILRILLEKKKSLKENENLEFNEQRKREEMERQQKRIQSDLQVESRLSTRVGPKQKTRKEAILPEKTEAILPPIPTPIPISHQVGPYRFHLIQSSPNRVWASVNECRVPNVKRYERILQRTTKLLSSRNKNDNVGVKRLLHPGIAPHKVYEISLPKIDNRPYALLFSLLEWTIPNILTKRSILSTMKKTFNPRTDQFLFFQHYSTHENLSKDVYATVSLINKRQKK